MSLLKSGLALGLVLMVGCVAKPQKVEVPEKEECHRKYVSVELDTYTNCLLDGMSYVQVGNIIGFAGNEVVSSGNSKTFQWLGRGGALITVSFVGDRLISKSQINLK